MMDCREFQENLQAYIERELTGDLGESVHTHATTCPRCAVVVRELRQTSELVRSLDRVSTPPGFDSRLRMRLSATRPKRQSVFSRFALYMRPALAAALVILALCGSALFLDMKKSEIDWNYLNTCRKEHEAFTSTNPLADESAALLRERVADMDTSL